mmetsp:Transcript_3581/g.13098  ORF Transcript_3581/g.13098 Transcript_3581/m.13098 type:complete len:279 (+) Transcript_3581:631-1467(+)
MLGLKRLDWHILAQGADARAPSDAGRPATLGGGGRGSARHGRSDRAATPLRHLPLPRRVQVRGLRSRLRACTARGSGVRLVPRRRVTGGARGEGGGGLLQLLELSLQLVDACVHLVDLAVAGRARGPHGLVLPPVQRIGGVRARDLLGLQGKLNDCVGLGCCGVRDALEFSKVPKLQRCVRLRGGSTRLLEASRLPRRCRPRARLHGAPIRAHGQFVPGFRKVGRPRLAEAAAQWHRSPYRNDAIHLDGPACGLADGWATGCRRGCARRAIFSTRART